MRRANAAAAWCYHEVLREELRGSPIRATLISPAAVDTAIWDHIDHRPGLPPRSAMLQPTGGGGRHPRMRLTRARSGVSIDEFASPAQLMHLGRASSVLRCPREHEASGLVLAADTIDGRHVVTGVLGCPVCEAEYPIREGVAYFVDSVPAPAAPRRDDVMRTAAMLGLTEPGGVIALAGRWASRSRMRSASWPPMRSYRGW